jgi:hypothetical protein
MNRDEQFKRNHRLFEIFMKEAFRNPALVRAVPDKADIVMLPDNDPELRVENMKLAKSIEEEGRQPVLVEVRLVPETRTVFVPHVEVVRPTTAAAAR